MRICIRCCSWNLMMTRSYSYPLWADFWLQDPTIKNYMKFQNTAKMTPHTRRIFWMAQALIFMKSILPGGSPFGDDQESCLPIMCRGRHHAGTSQCHSRWNAIESGAVLCRTLNWEALIYVSGILYNDWGDPPLENNQAHLGDWCVELRQTISLPIIYIHHPPSLTHA
jgi:hypothetical protein